MFLSGIMLVFLFVGVFGGIVVGLLVWCWGDWWLLVMGFVIFGLLSVVGVWVGSFVLLLVMCFVEGFGFVIVVVVVLVVLNCVMLFEWCNFVFGLWSIFMLVGMVLLMLVGLLFGGWCNGWFVVVVLMFVVVVVVLVMMLVDVLLW